MPFLVGAASQVINPEIGDHIQGQLYERFCEYIRDNLEANLLYLTDGQEQVLLGSLDFAGSWMDDDMPLARAAISARTGLPERSIILTATHTHAGPETSGLLEEAPKNERYVAALREWLAEAAQRAVESARPARMGWAQGEAHVGYNRRLCWADGTHSMYGDSSREDFTGLEGPDDPSHAVLWAVDEDNRPLVVAHNNCSHSTTLEGAQFASADFPGEARRVLREALGEIPVLYLQGASGDTSPWNMLKAPYRYDGELRLREMGALLAGETLRLMHEAEPQADPVLRHRWEDLRLGVRLPEPAALERARELQALGPDKVNRWEWVLATRGVLRLQEVFGEHPEDVAALHAVRVGDFALATNPCELYCQFGLDLKRRSPAAVTAVAQLADGACHYCPTIYGQLGGGYSGEAILWARLEPAAGYKIVDTTAKLLWEVWR